MAANSTVTLQSQLNLTGNLTANGTLNANSQDVAFIGASGTQVLFAGNNTLYDLDKAQGSSTLIISGNLALAHNFALNTGSVTITGSTISIQGDWINQGATVTAGAGSVVSFSGVNQNVTSGGQNFRSVVHSGSGNLVLQDPLTVLGSLTNSSGLLDTTAGGGVPVTVTGLTTVSGGTFLGDGSTTDTFTGGITVSGNGTFEAGSSTIIVGATLAVSGNGTFDGNQSALGATNVRILGGNFTAPNASGSFTVSGNWTNSSPGSFHANNGTVSFIGNAGNVAQNLTTASDHFYNLIENSGVNGYTPMQGAAAANQLFVDNNFTFISGTFDTNAHNGTVTGLTLITGGNYYNSNPAPSLQTLSGGLTLTGGIFNGQFSNVTTTNVNITGTGTVFAPDPNHSFSVSGNWSKTGTGTSFFPLNGTVTFTANSPAVQTLDTGDMSTNNTPFYNINHSGNGTLRLINHRLQTNNFTNNGTFDLNGNAWTVNGTITNRGIIELQGGEAVTAGSNDTTEGTWIYYGTGTGATYTIKDFGAVDYFNLAILDSGAGNDTFQLTSGLVANGTLTIQPGTLDVHGQNLTVKGLTTVATAGGHAASLLDSVGNATITLSGGMSLTGGLVASGGTVGRIVLGNSTTLSNVSASVDASDKSSIINGTLDLGNLTPHLHGHGQRRQRRPDRQRQHHGRARGAPRHHQGRQRHPGPRRNKRLLHRHDDHQQRHDPPGRQQCRARQPAYRECERHLRYEGLQ